MRRVILTYEVDGDPRFLESEVIDVAYLNVTNSPDQVLLDAWRALQRRMTKKTNEYRKAGPRGKLP